MVQPTAPAGWYPDHQGVTRWWDGWRWTDHVAGPSPSPGTTLAAPDTSAEARPPVTAEPREVHRSEKALSHWVRLAGAWAKVKTAPTNDPIARRAAGDALIAEGVTGEPDPARRWPRKQVVREWVLLGSVMVIAVGFMIAGLMMRPHIDRDWIRTSGVVVGQMQVAGPQPGHVTTYAFRDRDGGMHTVTYGLLRGTPAEQVGAQVTVAYDPQDPNSAVIGTPHGGYGWMLFAWIGVALIALFGREVIVRIATVLAGVWLIATAGPDRTVA